MIAHQNMRTRIPSRRAERIRESAHASKTRTRIKHDRAKTSESNFRLRARAKPIRAYASEEATRALKPGHAPAKSASGRAPHPPQHRLEASPEAQNKKPPEGGFRSQIYGWASRIRTYITGTKNQGPAIGRWPSVCHKAFCDYNVSGMVKPNKQPIRQNATTQYEHHLPYKEKGEPIALLAPKTLQRLRQQR